MRKAIYTVSAILGVLLTIYAVRYAYIDRGYFAIGSEYVFLFLPAIVAFAEFVIDDWREERTYGGDR